VNKTKIN